MARPRHLGPTRTLWGDESKLKGSAMAMLPLMPPIDGLYETHLTVASLDRSIPFYRDIVGLELARRLSNRIPSVKLV
jgi:hypothetical protein